MTLRDIKKAIQSGELNIAALEHLIELEKEDEEVPQEVPQAAPQELPNEPTPQELPNEATPELPQELPNEPTPELPNEALPQAPNEPTPELPNEPLPQAPNEPLDVKNELEASPPAGIKEPFSEPKKDTVEPLSEPKSGNSSAGSISRDEFDSLVSEVIKCVLAIKLIGKNANNDRLEELTGKALDRLQNMSDDDDSDIFESLRTEHSDAFSDGNRGNKLKMIEQLEKPELSDVEKGFARYGVKLGR